MTLPSVPTSGNPRPRLPEPVVRLANRGMGRLLSTLPGPAKRLLSGGRSVVIDGNTLDPSLQLFLTSYRLSGFQGLILNGDVAASRRNLDDATIKYAGQPAAVAVADVSIPGPAGPIPARHYSPGDGAAEPRALLVAYHGGGFALGRLDGWDGFYRQVCREADVHVLSVDYRLAPEHPAPAAVEDAYAAYLWAVEHAAELGADSARVAVGGDSAGGNLAALVSQAARDAGDPPPALQLLIYPVTDLAASTRSRTLFGAGFLLTALDLEAFTDCYLRGSELGPEDPRLSPLRAADLSGLPPALIVTAGFDPLRDEGEAYAERMRESGVPVDLRRYRSMIHGFTNFNGFGGEVSRSIADITSALRAHLSRG